MEKFFKIVDFLNYLQDYYSASICIKDFSGFIPLSKELHKALEPFLVHTHPYCLHIKKHREGYFDCLSMIPKILAKCIEKKTTFYGTCHGGLSEFVIPIINGGNVIGAITYGTFVDHDKRMEGKLAKLTKKHENLNIDELMEKISRVRVAREHPTKEILMALELVAQIFSITYKNFDAVDNQSLLSPSKTSDADEIVEIAIQYIKDHLTEQIKINDIAEKCNYCISYVSRCFNKKIGMNINTYINKMRVEVSKNYLLTSARTVSEIATIVGFSDSSYYSKVFTSLLGISPSEFRRRFT